MNDDTYSAAWKEGAEMREANRLAAEADERVQLRSQLAEALRVAENAASECAQLRQRNMEMEAECAELLEALEWFAGLAKYLPADMHDAEYCDQDEVVLQAGHLRRAAAAVKKARGQ